MKKVIIVSALALSFLAQARISVSPLFVNFGYVGLYSNMTRHITVFNQEDEPNRIHLSGHCFGQFNSFNMSCFYVPARGTCSVRVSFFPTREGIDSCSINLRDDFRDFRTITVQGQGLRR